MKNKIQIILLFVLFNQLSFASADQTFIYKSKKIVFALAINTSFDFAAELIVHEAKDWFPYVLGLERIANQTNWFYKIISFPNSYEWSIEINHKETIEIRKKSTVRANMHELSKIIKRKIVPIYQFHGFSLQIAYMKKYEDILSEQKYWSNEIDEHKIGADNLSIRIEGDMEVFPKIRLLRYKNGSYAIRYGLFKTYQKIKGAIQKMYLDEKHAQIIPIVFNLHKFEEYYGLSLLPRAESVEKNNYARIINVEKLTDQAVLAEIAKTDKDIEVREAAVEKIIDKDILADFAEKDSDFVVRGAAVKKISDQVLLAKIARYDKNWYVRKSAVKKLVDLQILEYFAKNDKDMEVREAAANRLEQLKK